jgi:hypothetical protein
MRARSEARREVLRGVRGSVEPRVAAGIASVLIKQYVDELIGISFGPGLADCACLDQETDEYAG